MDRADDAIGGEVPVHRGELPDYALGQLLRRAHARAARTFSAALAEEPIDGRHFGVLAALADGGPQNQRELGDRVGSDKVSTMRLVDDLEAAGLAVRRPVAGDRRQRAVELTEDGRRVFREVEEVARRVTGELTAHLGTEEREQLVHLLQRFVRAEPGHLEE